MAEAEERTLLGMAQQALQTVWLAQGETRAD